MKATNSLDQSSKNYGFDQFVHADHGRRRAGVSLWKEDVAAADFPDTLPMRFYSCVQSER